jgi:hypothetical protein
MQTFPIHLKHKSGKIFWTLISETHGIITTLPAYEGNQTFGTKSEYLSKVTCQGILNCNDYTPITITERNIPIKLANGMITDCIMDAELLQDQMKHSLEDNTATDPAKHLKSLHI